MIKTIFTPLTKLGLTCLWVVACCLVFNTASAQDTCPTAVPLAVGTACVNTVLDNAAVTNSNPIPAPTCGLWGAGSRDNWFSMTVPASGTLQIQVSTNGGLTDWAMSLWSGSCGALTQIECDDDDGPGLFPFLDVSGLTAGSTVFLSVWEWGTSTTSTANICAIAPPSACDLFPPLVVTAGATIEICEGEDAQLGVLAEGGFVAPIYWANLFFGSQNYQTGNLLDLATDAFCGASTNVFGMDFAADGTLYGIDNAGQLVTIDPVTCAQTVVGPSPSNGGQTWSGLAFNAADGMMYATSLAIGASTLYTIDLATGAPTVIGTSTQSTIWLAIDDAGNAFTGDLVDDQLYSINLATGVQTAIGPLGPNMNFAQDADFIPGTSVLIAAIYTGGGGNGIFAVDVTTGMALPLLGLSFPFPGQEAAGFALLAGDPADAYTVLWSPAGDLDDPTALNPIASPLATTTYCVTVSDACGNTGEACQTVIVNTADFADQLNCNSLINVSLDANCQAELDADDILEGTYPCVGLYDVDVNGTGSNIVGAGMVGQTVPVQVSVPGSDPLIYCWGNIFVEDKLPPVLECEDYTLACDVSTDPRPLPILAGAPAAGAHAGGEAIGPDGGMVTEVPLAVSGSNPGDIVTDVNISIALTHTWSSDLDVFLIAPDGTTVELATDVCGTGDDWDVTFDDQAALTAAAACAAAVPTLSGSVQPEGSLADFDGLAPNGTWTLMITDDVGGDGGFLGAVSIAITTDQAGAYEPTVLEPCGNVTLSESDVTVNGTCADAFKSQIVRTWTGTNASGMSATCVQTITVERATLGGITAPINYDGIEESAFMCGDFPNNPGLTPDENGNLEGTRACNETNFTLPLFIPKNSTNNGPFTFTFADLPSNAVVSGISVTHVDDGNLNYTLSGPNGGSAFFTSNFPNPYVAVTGGLMGTNPAGVWSMSINNSHYDTNISDLTLTVMYTVPVGPQGTTCDNIKFGYTDTNVAACGGTYDILRVWTVFEWCAPTNSNTYTQILKVMDLKDPIIAGLADMDVSTDFDVCTADVILPIPTVTDDCGDATYTVTLDTPDGTLVAIPCVGCGYLLQGLPVGTHTVTYTATDECGNSAEESIDIEVTDNVIPVAACETLHEVSLHNLPASTNVPTLVDASVFDDGSSDNCGIAKFEVRRMTSTIDFDWTTNGYKCNANDECIADSNPNGFVNWRDQGRDHPSPAIDEFYCKLPFGCGDVGTTVQVEFRVTDVNGNFNTCMVDVNVVDKVKPVISCPGNIVIECDEDVPALEESLSANPGPGLVPAYRVLQIVGGFATYTDDVVELVGYHPSIDNCESSVYIREAGSVNNCKIGAYSRIFQAEDGAGNFSSSCVQVINVVNSDPFLIVDTNPICTPFSFGDHPDYPAAPHSQYDDVEWPCDFTTSCTGSADNTDPDNAGRPIITEDECDQVSVTYNDWVQTVNGSQCELILRTWKVLDLCQFNEINGVPTSGYWEYTQRINVNDTNDPIFDSCDDLAPVSANHITCLGNVTLTQSATDACSATEDLNWSYVITPDAATGLAPIPGTGTDASGNYPIGNHSITWTVEDKCGNWTACTQLFYVNDDTAPNLVILTSTDVTLVGSNGDAWADLNVASLDIGSFDACSGMDELLIERPPFAVPTNPSSPPFSASEEVTFLCDDMPFVNIRVWGSDNVGNWSYALVQVVVEDPNDLCTVISDAIVAGSIETEEAVAVELVNVEVNGGSAGAGNMLTSMGTIDDGAFGFSLATGANYTIDPARNDNALNGISTYDLVLLSQHILGINELNTPYKRIAADINNNGSISAFDMIELRKLLLFVNTEFPDNESWRFIDADFVFPNPVNPFATTFPEVININNLTADELNADFVGVKIGDLDNSVIANSLQSADYRTSGELVFGMDDQTITRGEEVTVEFNAKDFNNILGYQFTLNFDQNLVEFVDVEGASIEVTSDNFGFTKLDEGVITTSWNDYNGQSVANDNAIFAITFKALANTQLSNVLSISSRYTAAEAYAGNDLMDVALEFNTKVAGSEFALYQNQPNPFKGETTIGFDLPETMTATLTVYDVSGRVLTVIEKEYAQGYNAEVINRADLNGAGVLYYQLDTKDFSATKKMILID